MKWTDAEWEEEAVLAYYENGELNENMEDWCAKWIEKNKREKVETEETAVNPVSHMVASMMANMIEVVARGTVPIAVILLPIIEVEGDRVDVDSSGNQSHVLWPPDFPVADRGRLLNMLAESYRDGDMLIDGGRNKKKDLPLP